MANESSIDPDSLRSDVRSGLTGVGLSTLLLLWGLWMIYDFGMSLLFGGALIFAGLTLVIFLRQALRPALELRRNNHTVF